MERIKEAVARAREARTTGVVTPTIGAEKPTAMNQGKITYTQTRTVDIPVATWARNRVIAGLDDSEFVDSYKILRTQVLQRMKQNGWNALAVTSSKSGEGKSLTAVNLAITLAMEISQTVLLVDADLRNPSINALLGLEGTKGLSDYLLDDVPVSDLLVNPGGIERFVVLPGGRKLPNSSEMLSSPKMADLVDELKSRYPHRMVIFDLPPLLSRADALAFAPHVDAALLVIGDGEASVADVQHAATMLEGTNFLGTVLNKAGA